MRTRVQIFAMLWLPTVMLGCGADEASERESSDRVAKDPKTAPSPPSSVANPEGLQSVRGTKVRLVPPAGFTPAPSFPGYVDEATSASIMVTEVPGPFAEVSAGFRDKAKLATQGMTLLESGERRQGQHPGLLARMDQEGSGLQVRKWVWVFGTEESSVILLATSLGDSDEELTAMKDAILSAQWDGVAQGGPGFEITEPGDLRLMNRMGDMLRYGETEKPSGDRKRKPLFMVGPAMGSGPVDDREDHARRRIEKTATVKDIEVESHEAVTIDGLPGFETIARGREQDTGLEIVVFQLMLYEPNKYWIAQGLVAQADRERWLPQFEKAARSFRRER